MKNILIGLLIALIINPVGFVGAQGSSTTKPELKSRECAVESFEEDELNQFNDLEDLQLLVRYIEFKEPIEQLTKLRAFHVLDADVDPEALYVVEQGIVTLEEWSCLLLIEMQSRGLSLPDGFNFKDYDIADPNFAEDLAQSLDGHESWGDVSAADISAVRSPEDTSKDGFEFGYEEDSTDDPNDSCAGGQCSDENGGTGNNGNSGDSSSDKFKQIGLGVAAAAVTQMIGGAGSGSNFNLLGIFQPGGVIGDGGIVDGMLESAGINTDSLFADTRPETVIKNETNESLSRVGPSSGQPAVLYGPGIKGGNAITGQTLSGAGIVKGDIRDTLLGWVRMLTSIAAILAVVAVIWGGVLMIASVGDDGRRDLGKKVIIYAIVGLFIIAGAYALVNLFIVGRFA